MSDATLLAGLATIGSNDRLFRRCLGSFAMTTQTPWRLFVVLDEGTPEQAEWLRSQGVTVDLASERRGLVPAYNLIAEHFLHAASEPYLCLLDDSIQVTAGWDEALLQVLRAHPEFGSVSCLQFENPAALFTAHCSIQTRAAVEALGVLKDPAYAPEQFDDMDTLMRWRAAGFTPCAVPHYVSHDVDRSSRRHDVDVEWARIAEKQALFASKWGIPDFDWTTAIIHHGCATCGYEPRTLRCNFCHRPQVPCLILTPGRSAAICDACARDCVALVETRMAKEES